MVSLNIYKNSANKFRRKTGFKIENEIEYQDQSIPKLIGILTQVFCAFGPHLVILAWTGDELSCRQAQNGVTFDFEVKFDLECQGQSPPPLPPPPNIHYSDVIMSMVASQISSSRLFTQSYIQA